MLPERIIKIIVFIGDVQRMTGQEAMASAMLGLSRILGIPKPFCAKALLSGAMAVRRHTAAVEKQGKALLATLRPDDKVLVLITRNYGVSDPILNLSLIHISEPTRRS
mgnify:CR=1 FL=1